MYPEVTIASPHKDGESVNKQKTEEGAGQKECAEKQAEWPRALLGGARLTSREPCISRCLSPGCLHPFPWLAPVLLGRLEAAVLPRAGVSQLARSTCFLSTAVRLLVFPFPTG